jgi:Zn-dependent protease with chaperone function
MYYGLGIAIVLAGFFTAHALLGMGVWSLRPALARWSERCRPLVRARVLLILNVGPMFGASVFGSLLLISYLLFEPANTMERVGWLMAVAAILSLVAWCRAGWKLVAARRATRDLAANWMANAFPVSIRGWDRVAYRLDHVFPLIAVVGVWRPRLFVAGQVLDQLASEELTAAIAHENGHLLAHDNLKRMLVNFAGELAWWVPGTTSLRRQWADAAELAADEFAAAGSVAQPLNLASALVKLARMTAAGTRPAMPAGAFLIESAGDILTQRVSWLVDVDPAASGGSERASRFLLASVLLTAGLFGLLLLRFDFFARLHQLIESAVQ